jgi:hypothetical protein
MIVSAVVAMSGPADVRAQFRPSLPAKDDQPTVRFTGAARSSGVQPFVFDAMSHVRMRVRINGFWADAILDTGAARTVLDEAFARRLGLATRPGFLVAGITGTTTGSWAEPVSLSLGDLTLDHLRAGLLDLNQVTAAAGAPASVLIGHDLFERTIADFDFTGSTVAFVDPSVSMLIPPGHTVPMGMTPRGTPYVSVSLNGRPPINAALDIGYNGSIMVSPDYAAAGGLLTDRRVSTVASIGAEGPSVNQVASCDRMDFAGSRLTDVPLEIPRAWNRPIPAVLGLDVIRRFRMVTEFGRQRVSLIPDPSLSGTPLPKDRSGLGARPTADGIVVVHVAAASPAEALGIRAGDVIEEINGHRADLDYVRSHPRMGMGPVGTRFVLRFNDGRVVSLTLSEYY